MHISLSRYSVVIAQARIWKGQEGRRFEFLEFGGSLNSEEEKPAAKKAPINTKFIWTSFSEQFVLGPTSNSDHSEAGKNSLELFAKVRVKAVFWGEISGFGVGTSASVNGPHLLIDWQCLQKPSLSKNRFSSLISALSRPFPLSLAIPAAIYRTAQKPGRKSAPKSTLGTPSRTPKSTPKAFFGALLRPGPWAVL